MITYICHNRNEKTTEKQPCFGTVCETSTCQCCGGRADVQSTIYWCRQCNVPLYGNRCSRCGMEAKKLTTDVRPVFPEERLLIEIILQKPFEFLKKSVWNGTGNHYFVDGKKIAFSVKELKKINADEVRRQYEKYSTQNCIFRKNRALAPHERSAVPLGTDHCPVG